MITYYDPFEAPDPDEWFAIDEGERVALVSIYHEDEDEEEFEEDSLQVHSVVHTVVENQVALGDEYPVKQTLARLMDEGLSRHDAIHAVGSVLAKYMWRMGRGEISSEEFTSGYFEELKTFTAQEWLDEFS